MPVKYPIAVLAALSAAAAVAVTAARGSDHQDTPEVELSPRMDVNDVYAFEGSSPDRIALAVTTSSPLTPAQTPGASFDPDLLYQIKVDNDGDAIEDLVLQVTFEGSGAGQRVLVRGPAPPQMTGSRTALVDVTPAVSGTVNTVLGSASGMQVFAGPRDDPFFLDLEQFFRIIPDRKPVSGPLSMLPDSATASAFRPAGSAVDYLAGINALAIVIELPESQLTAGGSSRLGIWATISR
jgi:hypothetical protein